MDRRLTFDDWLGYAGVYLQQHAGHQRVGQAYFNSLYEHRPDVADKIRSTSYDPFYVESLNIASLERFFNRVQELWNS